MAQNLSHAVMSQRHEAHDSLDHFPTPSWGTRALCEWLSGHRLLRRDTAWEPACAEGYMARPLSEYFGSVHSSDIHDYGFGEIADFLLPSDRRADWIITNPPFRLAEQFARTAIERSNIGAAMLVRTAFLEGAARYRGLFDPVPPSDILQFVERIPMVKGRVDKSASTATSYCWLVWRKDAPRGTLFHWLAPCRKRLERDEDYAPIQPAEAAE
jgi:hypothetical protein